MVGAPSSPDRAPSHSGASEAYGRPSLGRTLESVTIWFCDDRGAHGFSWIVEEPMTRTSHALADGGRVWLVDPIRFDPALERVATLGRPAAVLQLLDRHNRDCAAVARELGVTHLFVPDAVPESPFEAIAVRRTKRWRETALWWPAERTLVVAEAIATNGFFTGGREPAGVHLLMRLAPPRDALQALEPEHLLVGHGEGLHGPNASDGLRRALDHARSGLPSLALRTPALALDAIRRRRPPSRERGDR
jgi:hypothetical protein